MRVPCGALCDRGVAIVAGREQRSKQAGAEATTPVRAYEFDTTAVRLMCQEDPAMGSAVARWVGDVLAHRLHSARIRLLDLYAPYGSGSYI